MTSHDGDGKLPVDLERLRGQFPSLTDDDLEAYVEVTQRVLANPKERARLMREVMAQARAAQEKTSSGAPLGDDEALALCYLRAVEKMQR